MAACGNEAGFRKRKAVMDVVDGIKARRITALLQMAVTIDCGFAVSDRVSLGAILSIMHPAKFHSMPGRFPATALMRGLAFGLPMYINLAGG